MTIFFLVLPALESALMDQRRALIREMTEVAWSTISLFEKKEKAGTITRKQAQYLAANHLRQLRYGIDSKDYFWINDMHPRIVMHPYRPDLEGKDVSDFTDSNGKRLFVEFVKIVTENGSGYVDYKWQWMDDPGRIVSKISFVKAFKPWNWVVGTGIYVDDIEAEIASITKKITLICIGILVIVFLLSFVIIWQGIRVEKERRRIQEQNWLQQEQLFQASKMASVGTLVSGVAHEINNPNTSILLNATNLKKIWRSLVPMLEEYIQARGDFRISGMTFSELQERIPLLLDHIEDGAQRIRDIVSELKDFSRIKPPEMNDKVDVNLAVEKAKGLVANLIQKATSDFSMDLQPNIPLFRGNIQKIEQVIINLLINSCQALKDKKQKILVRTGYDPNLDYVTVEVRDTGIGIPSDLMDRIKDPFFTTKQTSGSTGLGLAISDRIVKDHGGRMNITSSLETGTLVKLSFPIQPVEKAKERQ
jgi:signal transduction histidine kinase